MTNRTKTRLLFLGVLLLALILNSVVNMHPKGLELKNISLKNRSYKQTKFMIYFAGNELVINDDFNKVIMLYGVTKEDVNFTVNDSCRFIQIKNRKVELKTEIRTLEILDKKVNGMGRQLFGITKQNIDEILVDSEGYFMAISPTNGE